MMETVYNAGDEKALLPTLKYSKIIPTLFIRDDGNRLPIYMIDKNASGDVKNFSAYLIFLYITGNGIQLRKLEIPMVFVTVHTQPARQLNRCSIQRSDLHDERGIAYIIFY